MRTVAAPTAEAMASAERVVRQALAPTPVVAAPSLGPGVLLKLEHLAPTGSFKVRGALAAVAAARQADPGALLVAASAGNHGLGVAWAAERLGARAVVVVPETAAEPKVRALATFDVELVRHGATYDEAEAHALDLAAERGGRFISPYNDPDVIAGQATVGTELVAQVPDLATVVVPVGGGGLLAGVGLAMAGRRVRLVGVEPERSAGLLARLHDDDGRYQVDGATLADGLAGRLEEGSVTVPLARALGAELVTVDEEQLAGAMREAATGLGLVLEASGAAALAAWLADPGALAGDGPTVLLLTGRNVAASVLARILDGGVPT